MKKWISQKQFKNLHYAERVRDLLKENKPDIEVIVVEDQKYSLSAYFTEERTFVQYDTFVNGFVSGVVYEATRRELEKQEQQTAEIRSDFTEVLKKL